MNLYDYLATVFGEDWDHNRIGIFAGKGQQEDVRNVIKQVKTLEEWQEFASHVEVDRGVVISEMESVDAAFVLMEELMQEEE